MSKMLYATATASVSELKKNPMATFAAGDGFPVVILNRNVPAFYCVPPQIMEEWMDRLDDAELNALADSRAGSREIAVTLDDI